MRRIVHILANASMILWVVLVLFWVRSWYYRDIIEIVRSQRFIHISATLKGGFELEITPPYPYPEPDRWHWDIREQPPAWGDLSRRRWGLHVRAWSFMIGWPLMLTLPTIVPGIWLVHSHLRRRTRLGLCPACGYDLRATPERCPECGAVPAAAKGVATQKG